MGRRLAGSFFWHDGFFRIGGTCVNLNFSGKIPQWNLKHKLAKVEMSGAVTTSTSLRSIVGRKSWNADFSNKIAYFTNPSTTNDVNVGLVENVLRHKSILLSKSILFFIVYYLNRPILFRAYLQLQSRSLVFGTKILKHVKLISGSFHHFENSLSRRNLVSEFCLLYIV